MSEQRKELLDRCLDVALANRQFEIQLLWQRTIVFWGFVLALFAGVSGVIDKHRHLAAVLALTGVIFSMVWTLVNRGSRSWQESWEQKASEYMLRRYGDGGLEGTLFNRRLSSNPAFWLWRGRRYSVSGLLVALSDLVLLFWLALSLHLFPFSSTLSCSTRWPDPHANVCKVVVFGYFTVFCVVGVLYFGLSRDAKADLKARFRSFIGRLRRE